MENEVETFEQAFFALTHNDSHKDPDGGWVSGHSHSELIRLANNLKAAHEREMAEKDAVHRQWRKNYRERLADKDAQIMRYKAALKPVIECSMKCVFITELEIRCHKAVIAAQRIYNEGAK